MKPSWKLHCKFYRIFSMKDIYSTLLLHSVVLKFKIVYKSFWQTFLGQAEIFYCPIFTLKTVQNATCEMKKEIHIVLCRTPSPPSPINERIFLFHICIHPPHLHASFLIIFIMFNCKYYLGEWYYHKNWLQTLFIHFLMGVG